jgi:hypothetical protein
MKTKLAPQKKKITNKNDPSLNEEDEVQSSILNL